MSYDNGSKAIDEFLNPKYYQVPNELKKKYQLKLHERFNMFEKQKDVKPYPYTNLYSLDKNLKFQNS